MKQEDMEVGREYVNKGMCKWHYQGRVGNSQTGRFKDQHGHYHNMRYDRMEEAPQYPNPPLPHCEERIAFAKGANIEFEDRCGTHSKWMFTGDPKWHANVKYRVKVEKTEDDLRIEVLKSCICDHQAILDDYKKELAELKPTVHY
jgi:hypothetical protein